MDQAVWTLRVTAPARDGVRVATRRHQFTVGRPLAFDAADPMISALEYAAGAVGAEVVAGLRAAARRRRMVLDAVEAVVDVTVEHALVYLDVVGETGRPRISRIGIKVFASTTEDERAVRRLLDEVLERLPLVGTLGAAAAIDTQLGLTA